jgi:hypothetical protein
MKLEAHQAADLFPILGEVPTEFFEGEWHFPKADGHERWAVITYADEPSPEMGTSACLQAGDGHESQGRAGGVVRMGSADDGPRVGGQGDSRQGLARQG